MKDTINQNGAVAKYIAKAVAPGKAVTPVWNRQDKKLIPTAADIPPIPVSPLFVEAMKDTRCPRCTFGHIWFSPDTVPEATIHLNPIQTAFAYTAGEALARLTGETAYRRDMGKIIFELLRLFLLTHPALAAMKWDERPGQVGRGAMANVTWAQVQAVQPQPAAPPVETVNPLSPPDDAQAGSALNAEPIEPIDATERLYTQSPQPEDLYGDSEGDAYPDK